MINVKRHDNAIRIGPCNLFTTRRQCCTVAVVKTTNSYMTVLFISIDRMPFLHHLLIRFFAVVITPGFYLHHVEVVAQDPASGSLKADTPTHKLACRHIHSLTDTLAHARKHIHPLTPKVLQFNLFTTVS